MNIDSNGYTSFRSSTLQSTLDTLPVGILSSDESSGLILMREEEKLAHDVYTSLYQVHALPIFDNISNSEQTHTDAVKLLLDRYSLTDPVTDTTVGSFTDSTLKGLYDTLVAQGTTSLLDGLYVVQP